jgi:hypothetical protein
MRTESDALRAALFAQMKAPPLPDYTGDTVILRGRKISTSKSVAQHWPVSIAANSSQADGDDATRIDKLA